MSAPVPRILVQGKHPCCLRMLFHSVGLSDASAQLCATPRWQPAVKSRLLFSLVMVTSPCCR